MSLQSYDTVLMLPQTPAGGWQLKIRSLMSLDVPWFLCFKIYSWKSGIWNIISPNNFWSLHLGWALSGRQCAHQAVFLNQCLIFSFIPTAANQRPLNCIVANEKPPLNISIKSETAKKCLLVFPCLRQGPGQAPSVQISILIWAERALGRHRAET